MLQSAELLKFNGECVDTKVIWNEACAKAVKEVNKYVAEHGEPMYCGFGSIQIYPARGNFITFCKREGIGSKGYPRGYRLSYYDIMPKGHPQRHTQSLDVKEVAVEAFANILQSYGIRAYGQGRAD